MKKINLDHRFRENFNWPLLFTALGLIASGLINLYSTSGANQAEEFSSTPFAKQMIFSLVGLTGLLSFFFFDYRKLKSLAWPLFGLSLFLLIAVKFYGITAGGATRWLPFGPFRFQPSELTKLSVVLLLSFFLSRRHYPRGLDFKDLVRPLVILTLPFVLILKQPDMGTALHLILTVCPLFFFIKFRPRVLITVISLIAAGVVWITCLGGQQFLLKHNFIKPYHLARYRYYMSPEESPTGQGWQIIQAKSAIGSGQIFGQGFQEGSQQRYGFLPAPETDFAFAALAEEWGFVGASFILLLFFGLIWSALNVVRASGENFGAYLALGLTSLIFWQMTINLAMVVGLFPVVGIPLPFISYGGSSLIINLMAITVIANIGLNRYFFQEESIRQNPRIWQEGVTEPKQGLNPVRRLAPPNPEEPEPYPEHRLPHRKPWLKYLRNPDKALGYQYKTNL
ncbi:MAG: rod shape-determining protein RodA [Deltaproteobacteria bacterium]|nr:rod shape-determining protein RodA [Deltaproteobacteria bacterium]